MKNRKIIIVLFWGIVITLYAIIHVRNVLTENYSFQRAEEELSRELGVNLEDYPCCFPEAYFYSVLKPGMSLRDVHEIVTEYETVYVCGPGIEVYYYYSKDAKKARRFEIIYDDFENFYLLRAEDEDSRSIFVDGCGEGRLEEK